MLALGLCKPPGTRPCYYNETLKSLIMALVFNGPLAVHRKICLFVILFCFLNASHAGAADVKNPPSTQSGHAKVVATSSSITQSAVSGHGSTITASKAHRTSVALSAALSAASTAAAQQTKKAFVPPIPLPRNNTKYKDLIALAKGLPHLQRTSEPIKSANGAAAYHNNTLKRRSEDEFQAMLDELGPPQPDPAIQNLRQVIPSYRGCHLTSVIVREPEHSTFSSSVIPCQRASKVTGHGAIVFGSG